MRRIADILHGVALTLWVGGLWSIGYLVAPALFHSLGSDRQLAGQLAGQLFDLIGWVLILLFAVVGLFGVQPLLAQLKADALPREVMASVLRDRFAAWHGVSSVLYLLQSLFGLLLVATVARGVR